MRSMTGFGQASWQGGGKRLSVEVRSVNQRFLDVKLSLPRECQAWEPELKELVNGLAAVALLGCVAGVLIGAAQWALGSRSNNYSHASDGKSKVLYGLLGAFVIAAAAAVINFFYSSGSAVK